MTDAWESDEKFVEMATYLPPSVPLPLPKSDPLETSTEAASVPKPLSKSALKKLAKNKGKNKKEKPQWGDGSKKVTKAKKAAPTAAPSVKFVNTTPKGQKKDFSAPMAEAYHPAAVESSWQDYWESSGYYTCDPVLAQTKAAEDKFVMVIPPPNVTGSLHLGHALTAAVEDTLVRWHRMCGDATMYVPGTDHAGIATQSIVEKMLMKEQGENRHSLGREKFVEKVWEWKGEYGDKITNQLRCLGSSVDWSRERFTMDDMCSEAVVEAFNLFHERGLLYRANRLGNWSCALKSAISDIEVDSVDLEGRTFMNVKTHKGNPADKLGRYEFGVMTSFAYKVDGSDEEIVVATTRLETMLGDTAVAVHPEDPRYKHLQGSKVIHPFSKRLIPIVTDAILVDMTLGTGAVKITPAHDPNDYECGKRNDLEFICILSEDGAINANGTKQFEGMMRYDARIAVEEALTEMGLYRGKEPNKMRLALCSRSGDILEPMITPQWYVNCDSMAKRATDAVRNGELKILPEDHEKTWFQWLDNIRDWCVSRQLWWGHQIPAWFATKEGENFDKNDMNQNDRWIVARNEEEAYTKAMEKLNCTREELTLKRDDDVLDTWFSSGLFPFSVFGWPNNTEDMKAFYPTSLLETGSDILFFWVARMVMMGLELTDILPFQTVYLHAMVRDKEGRKMSKSLGNVIDPLEVINGCTLKSLHDKLESGNLPQKEVTKAKNDQTADFPNGIPECGSDALRFGLLAYTVQGRDVNLDIKRVVGYRNFCNKLWNATRFALQFVSDFKPTPTLLDDLMSSGKMAVRDTFMISRLMSACGNVNDLFTAYKFGDAQMAAYSLWIDDLCDVYLELIKPVVYNLDESNADHRWAAQATLWISLETGLRLLHPMMPFVTEELWHRLPGRGTLGETESKSIMVAPYPICREEYKNEKAEKSMETTKAIIKACRSLRASYNIANKTLTKFFVKISSDITMEEVRSQSDDIMTLGKGASIDINPVSIPKGVGLVVVDESTSLLMDLTGMVDFKAEIKKLQKSLSKTLPLVEKLESKINAPGYEENVSAELKKSNQEKLAGLKMKAGEITAAIENFEKLEGLEGGAK